MLTGASSGKNQDPGLKLSGQTIPFIANNVIVFLGGPTTNQLAIRSSTSLTEALVESGRGSSVTETELAVGLGWDLPKAELRSGLCGPIHTCIISWVK